MREPAQKTLVNRFLNWETVERRAARYPNIAEQFSIERLQRCSDRPPYYCHYMSWRLGTWHDERLLHFDLPKFAQP